MQYRGFESYTSRPKKGNPPMNLNDTIKTRLTAFFRENYDWLDVVEVVDWRDTTISTGDWDACYYEYAGVVITYLDSNGETRNYEYDDLYSSLISYLCGNMKILNVSSTVSNYSMDTG